MPQITLLQNESGFTLVELLVSMIIMLVGLLGLFHSVNIAMEHNLKNQMRGEVVRIAQDTMNDMRSKPFDTVFNPTTTVPTHLRNIKRTYTVNRIVNSAGSPVSVQYQVNVRWKYKNVSTTHSVMSVRSRVE